MFATPLTNTKLAIVVHRALQGDIHSPRARLVSVWSQVCPGRGGGGTSVPAWGSHFSQEKSRQSQDGRPPPPGSSSRGAGPRPLTPHTTCWAPAAAGRAARRRQATGNPRWAAPRSQAAAAEAGAAARRQPAARSSGSSMSGRGPQRRGTGDGRARRRAAGGSPHRPRAPRFGSAGRKGPADSTAPPAGCRRRPPPGEAAARSGGRCGFPGRIPAALRSWAQPGGGGGRDRERTPARLGRARSEVGTLPAAREGGPSDTSAPASPGAGTAARATPPEHLPRAAPNMAGRHLPCRELRAPACTAPRRTACRSRAPHAFQGRAREGALALGRKWPVTLPEVLGRQLARHRGGPASGAEGAAPTSEWPRGGGVWLRWGRRGPRRRPAGRGRGGRETGSRRGLPLGGERASPSAPRSPRSPRRRGCGGGKLDGPRSGEVWGSRGSAGGRWGCVEGCGARSGFSPPPPPTAGRWRRARFSPLRAGVKPSPWNPGAAGKGAFRHGVLIKYRS